MDEQSKRTILFVDDEPRVLEGLRNMLRKMRHEWEMNFAESGAQALAYLEQHPVELVVTDMMMPVMDGAQLLTQIKQRWPSTVRFVLSGHSKQEMLLRSASLAHQFLAKPCDADSLKQTVERAFALRSLTHNEVVSALAADGGAIPALPALYDKLCAALSSPCPTMKVVGEIIAQDVTMSAKVLQLVNSSFFGLRRRVDNVGQAVTFLGLDTIKALVLTAEVFARFPNQLVAEFAIDKLYGHSAAVGSLALRIIKDNQAPPFDADAAMTAGMLHDFGKLLLVKSHTDAARTARRRAQTEGLLDHEAELAVLGATHAEIGAYVLGLWGLPDPVVEAVGFHHQPRVLMLDRFTTADAVHVADAIIHERDKDIGPRAEHLLDNDQLARIGAADKLDKWRAWATETEATR